jgi:hypothetical protein
VGVVPRCQAIKHDGTSCERIVGAAQEHCYSHDPSRAEERHRNSSKAGSYKPGGELGEVKAKLRQLGDDVLSGAVDRASGSVAAQILGVYLRAVELERKIREQDELEERLEVLEARARTQRGGNTRWG